MNTRKQLSAAQARRAAQGDSAAQAPAPQGPQEAQGRAQEAAAPAAQAERPPQEAAAAQGAPQARQKIPGAPRNYQPETRTAAQAAQDDPGSFAWTIPAPVHGVTGFYKQTAFKAQEDLGGEFTPEEIIGEGDEALIILISNAKFLAHGEIIQNALVVQHEEFGGFYLRCVRNPKGGFLIGIIDDFDATYGACEWYETAQDAAEAWTEWTDLINPKG